jgi:hypothetical protein
MGNSGAIFSDIAPTLESTLANPQGLSPADEAAMETGAMQSAGGANAGAVGQGSLLAARTKNAGTAQSAIADAARGAGENLSKNLLGIRSANAGLKQKQRSEALQGLEGLYGTTTGAGNTALGQVAPLVQANTAAENASWNWMQPLNALISAGGALGAAKLGAK